MKQQTKSYEGILQGELAYEARPYFVLFVGAIGIYDARLHGSLTSFFSGVILLVCGTLLLHWRKQHRRR